MMSEMTLPGRDAGLGAQQRYRAARRLPPLPIRLLGRAVSRLIVRAPWLWPLVRRPNRWLWDRLAVGWDRGIKPDSPEHLAPLAAACEQLGTAPARVLEVGTGTGAGAVMLARRFGEADVLGVDLSEAMVGAARAKLPGELADRVRFAVADGASLPRPEAPFDLVVQLNVPPFLDQVAAVLAGGGHVIVADSLGEATPYHVPERLLRRGFERRGVEFVASGRAGAGTFFVARRPAAVGAGRRAGA